MTKPHKIKYATGGMQIIERNIADLRRNAHLTGPTSGTIGAFRMTDQPDTTEQVRSAENAGRIQLDIEQAALFMDVQPDALMTGDLARAYMRGRIQGLAVIRQALLQKARDGDMAAIKEYLQCHADSQPDVCNDDRTQDDIGGDATE